uniref:Uncharacterized protein n=1 Tax=Moniliophthora roreri TaxID=221103 RepID=A0A0W0EU01_MONRR
MSLTQSSSAQQTNAYSDDFTHQGEFHPTVFKLLYIINSEHHNEEITRAIGNNDLHQLLWGSLLFLWGHCQMINEAIAQIDRQAGFFAWALCNGDDRIALRGPIMVPLPPPDLETLPLHVQIPETGPNGEPFPTDENVNPKKLMKMLKNLCLYYKNTRPVVLKYSQKRYI